MQPKPAESNVPLLPQGDNEADVKAKMEAMQSKINELEHKVKDSGKSDDDEDDDEETGMIVLKVLFGLAIIGVLWWLCPSNEKMEAKISQEVCKEYISSMARTFNAQDEVEALGLDDLDDEDAVDIAAEIGDIKIKNYGLVKLGYFDPKRGKEGLAGIGICGFVITRSVAEKLPKSRTRQVIDAIK